MFETLKRLKSFGYLSNHLKKTRLGSHHSEKTEFLRQILRKKPTFVIGLLREDDSDPPSKGASPFSTMGDITVDPKGVGKLLDELNVHKASGPDGLNARVHKECSNEIPPILALIYNESLARGDVPDEWRQANASPVFKKDEKIGCCYLQAGVAHMHLLQNPRAYFSQQHQETLSLRWHTC